ncbi:MAG: ATP-binding protein [Pseudomonadota bacterium]
MISRELYLQRIRPFIDKDIIKVLTGIRRSGKSVLLKLIANELMQNGVQEKQCISYNFENMRYRHLLTAEALHDEIAKRIEEIGAKAYLFLDEIQEVKNWELCINSLRVAYDCDIYLTGSNAKLLSGELASYLSGRYIECVIYPFSYAEFIALYKEYHVDTDAHQLFSTYLQLGGMPYLGNLQFVEEPCTLYLTELYHSVVLKDIVKRYGIRDIDLLERIIVYVMAHVGTIFSATTISKYLKSESRNVAPETILNYLKACEDAFLLYRVKREDMQRKKILASNEKFYIADHGIRQAVWGRNMRDINLVLENIVYMELLRRGYRVTVGKVAEKEIDFIAVKQENKIYIQVCYLLASESTIEREFGVFKSIPDNYPKYVLSLDDFDMSRDGIVHKNIKTFLLQDSI